MKPRTMTLTSLWRTCVNPWMLSTGAFGIVPCVGFSASFRKAYFWCHADVTLWFKLAAGKREAWTWDWEILWNAPYAWCLFLLFMYPGEDTFLVRRVLRHICTQTI